MFFDFGMKISLIPVGLCRIECDESVKTEIQEKGLGGHYDFVL